jgi:hypothetical protein
MIDVEIGVGIVECTDVSAGTRFGSRRHYNAVRIEERDRASNIAPDTVSTLMNQPTPWRAFVEPPDQFESVW